MLVDQYLDQQEEAELDQWQAEATEDPSAVWWQWLQMIGVSLTPPTVADIDEPITASRPRHISLDLIAPVTISAYGRCLKCRGKGYTRDDWRIQPCTACDVTGQRGAAA
jgi:hypothetical protein